MMDGGFGLGPFGEGPFGEADWGENVFWRSIPLLYRETQPEDLRRFLQAVADYFSEFKVAADRSTAQRDPYEARTQFNDVSMVQVLSSSLTPSLESEDGQAFVVLAANPDTLFGIAPGWMFVIGMMFAEVIRVDPAKGELWIRWDQDVSLGTYQVRPTPLMQLVAYDLDVDLDQADPERLQRSLVGQAAIWHNTKGTKRGIRLRAALSGFNAVVSPLWRIPAPGVAPADKVFELPFGSGRWYTTIAPEFLMYDQVPADLVPTDTSCSDFVPVPVSVVAVTGQSGDWVLEFAAPASAGAGFVLTGPDGFEYVVEQQIDPTHVRVATLPEPPTGSYAGKPDCQISVSCDWCPSYKIGVDLEVVDPDLLADPIAMQGAFERMIAKIATILPAHVSVAFWRFTTDQVSTVLTVPGGTAQTLVFDLYDEVPADVQPADTLTVVEH